MSQLPAEAGFGNPNGILSQSPGLRATSHPGAPSHQTSQPQRGCGHSIPPEHDISHNAVGVVSISERAPKVGAWRVNLGLAADAPLGHLIVERHSWAGAQTRFDFVTSFERTRS